MYSHLKMHVKTQLKFLILILKSVVLKILKLEIIQVFMILALEFSKRFQLLSTFIGKTINKKIKMFGFML